MLQIAEKYAQKSDHYKSFMKRVHMFIISVRKEEKKLRDEENSKKDGGKRNQKVNKALEYVGIGEQTVKMNITNPSRKHEDNKEELKQLLKLKNFYDKIEWREEEKQGQGTTWLELYTWYTMHGGVQEEEKLIREDPLKRHVSLQTKVAKFKARTRKIATFCMDTKDEWHVGTAYNRQNRLSKLAITNKHACIRGVPKVNAEEAEAITEAILAMRGAHRKKQKEALKEGHLEIQKRSFAYKGTSDIWMGVAKGYDDWTTSQDEQVDPVTRPLKCIHCPACGAGKSTEGLKLKIKIGFCNLTCKLCEEVTSTKEWTCECS